jgi:hypothetical protein
MIYLLQGTTARNAATGFLNPFSTSCFTVEAVFNTAGVKLFKLLISMVKSPGNSLI